MKPSATTATATTTTTTTTSGTQPSYAPSSSTRSRAKVFPSSSPSIFSVPEHVILRDFRTTPRITNATTLPPSQSTSRNSPKVACKPNSPPFSPATTIASTSHKRPRLDNDASRGTVNRNSSRTSFDEIISRETRSSKHSLEEDHEQAKGGSTTSTATSSSRQSMQSTSKEPKESSSTSNENEVRELITEQLFRVGSCREKLSTYQQKLDNAANELAVESKKLAELIFRLNSFSPAIDNSYQHQTSPVLPSTSLFRSEEKTVSTTPLSPPNVSSKDSRSRLYEGDPPEELIHKTKRKTILREDCQDRIISAHKRKPRCLLFNPCSPNLLASSSLDGSIHFWSLSHHRKKIEDKGEIPKEKLRHDKFVSDICWDKQTGTKLAASFLDLSPSQVVIISTENLPKLSLKFLDPAPHKKEVTTLRFFSNDSNRLLTASADHHLISWSIQEKTTSIVHNLHSSQVNAICHLSADPHLVYTGGADRRVVGYSMEKDVPFLTKKFDEKVCSIIENPAIPDLLLISKTSKENQLVLFDRRTPQGIMKQLSWTQMDKTVAMTQNILPSFSPSGRLIACGSTDPVVNIWDIRYLKVGKPTQTLIGSHEKRVLRSEFHPEKESVIASLSSDRSLLCTWFDVCTHDGDDNVD